MIVGFTTTCAVSAYHHLSCELEPRSWRGLLNTTLCDIVCHWLMSGRWFSPCNPVWLPRYNWNIVESGNKQTLQTWPPHKLLQTKCIIYSKYKFFTPLTFVPYEQRHNVLQSWNTLYLFSIFRYCIMVYYNEIDIVSIFFSARKPTSWIGDWFLTLLKKWIKKRIIYRYW